MIFKPFNRCAINPAAVGMVLVVLSAFVLFLYQSGLAEAQDPRANNEAKGNPTITGTPQASETLTVDTSEIWDPDGIDNATFEYQWISNDGMTDTDIEDATSSTYIIKPWDLGEYIKVRVNFTDDAGNEETLTSAAIAEVEASPNHPAEGWLQLYGMAEVGQELRVYDIGRTDRGIGDANGLRYATFNYQWIRGDGTTDVEIPNATGQFYMLVDADEGKTIKVRVSFADDGGNTETLTSLSTTAVTARPNTSDLSAPSNLSVAWSRGEEKGNELNWTAPEGPVTGYQILRLEKPTRSRWWEPYPYGCTPLMEVHVSDTGSYATTYTDTDVAEGALYSYSVRTISSDGIGRKSASSGGRQYRPPHTPTGSYWPGGVPGTPSQAPTNLASSQIKNGIGLTWEAPEGEVTGYQILRRIPEQCDFGYRVYVENTDSTDTHWADRSVVAGTRYEYHVRAVNDVGPGKLETRRSTSIRPTRLVVGPEPNNPATGTPIIIGTAQVGQTLTADLSGIADADGMHWASFSYQWLSGRDTEIDGATSSTYTVQASDADKVFTLRVEFMDDSGYEESLTSAATAAVAPNVPATGAPAITGTAEVGETLTAYTSGIFDTDGLDNVSFSYQWIHSDGIDDWDVDGATGATYAVTAADVDKALKLRVNFTDDKGSVESLTSSATAVVPVEAAFTFSIDGTTVTCDYYNVDVVNRPKGECEEDPSSIDQGASDEIEVEIEIARSVNSQLYKFRFHIYQVEDSIGRYNSVEANDLCLGPGLVDSVSMEVTPDDGSGYFTYTDEGTIFELCPAGTYQLYVPWYRYHYEDQEYEYAGTFRRYFFIDGDEEEDTSIEQVKFIKALYPDPPVSHGEVQIQGTKQPTALNRELTTLSLTIDGLVPDTDTATTDYVVRVRIIGDGGPGKTVPWCHVGNVGYSYRLKTVPEDGQWEMDAHVLGGCISHWWPDTLQVELLDGTDLTDYSKPIVIDGSHVISPTGGLAYPTSSTHEFIAGIDISLDASPNSPATGAPAISGTAQVGQTLAASTSGIADNNGLTSASYAYQWIANDGTSDSDIQDATSSTYTLVTGDVGKTIKVKVSFTDDAGNNEGLTSMATDSVVAAPASNSPATGAPTITGTVQVGETLTASTSGISDADGLTNVTYSYQWLSDRDSAIAGATSSTYTVQSTDNGKSIKVRVSFTDDAGNDESLTSAATEVGGPRYDRPHGLRASAVGGAITLTWEDPAPLPSYSYSYYEILRHRPELGESEPVTYVEYTQTHDRTFIDSAVEPGVLYVYAVRAVVDYLGNLGPASDPVEVRMSSQANSPSTGAPTIIGSAQVGEILTADVTGIADADGLTKVTYSYQWLSSSDTAIAGATSSTYTLAATDVGKAIKVRVTFTDDAGYDESLTSAATVAVVAEPEPSLTLSDFDAGDGQEVLASALIRAGDRGRKNDENQDRAWYATDSSDWHASGELQDGLLSWNNMTVNRVVYFPATGVFRFNEDDPIHIGESFDAGGVNSGLTIWVQTETQVVSFLAKEHIKDSGARWINFEVPEADRPALNAVARGDLIIVAVSEPTPPKAPTNLTAEASEGSVSLNWTAPEDDSVTGYRILRMARDADPPQELTVLVEDTGTTATSYADDTVSLGSKYRYQVQAVNEAGASVGSGTVDVDTEESLGLDDFDAGDGQHVLASALIRAGDRGRKNDENQDRAWYATDTPDWHASGELQDGLLSWNNMTVNRVVYFPSTGVLRFNEDDAIHIGESFDAGGVNRELTIWVQTEAEVVSFRAKEHIKDSGPHWINFEVPEGSRPVLNAIAKDDLIVVAVTEPSVEGEEEDVPSAPSGLVGGAGNGAVVLAWDDPENETITKYQVRWKEKGSVEWTSDWTAIPGSNADTVAHLETGLASGTTYVFELRAINAAGEGKEGSVEATPVGLPEPPVIVDIEEILDGQIEGEEGGVKLTWEAPAGKVTGYQVLRQRPNECDDDYVVLVADTGNDQVTYKDTDVNPGVLYWYRVNTINDYGLSQMSNVAVSRWYDDNASDPDAPDRPLGLEGRMTQPGIRLEWWFAPTGEEEVTGYRILRKELNGCEEAYRVIEADTKNTELFFIDPDVEVGNEYSYRVKAVNEKGVGNWSKPVTVEALPVLIALIVIRDDNGQLSPGDTSKMTIALGNLAYDDDPSTVDYVLRGDAFRTDDEGKRVSAKECEWSNLGTDIEISVVDEPTLYFEAVFGSSRCSEEGDYTVALTLTDKDDKELLSTDVKYVIK